MNQLNNNIINKEAENVSLGDITAPVIIKYAGKLCNKNFQIEVEIIKNIAEYIEKHSIDWMYTLDNKIFHALKNKDRNMDDEVLKRFSKILLINIVALFVLNIAKKMQDENIDSKNTESYLTNFKSFDKITYCTKEDISEMIKTMLK